MAVKKCVVLVVVEENVVLVVWMGLSLPIWGYDDSEVPVEKHDEAYCALQLCVVGIGWDAQVVVYGA